MPYPCCCTPVGCCSPAPETLVASWTDPCFAGFSKTLSNTHAFPGEDNWANDDTVAPADPDCTFGLTFVSLRCFEGTYSASVQGWKGSFGIAGVLVSVSCDPFEIVFDFANTAGDDCCDVDVFRVVFTE